MTKEVSHTMAQRASSNSRPTVLRTSCPMASGGILIFDSMKEGNGENGLSTMHGSSGLWKHFPKRRYGSFSKLVKIPASR
jgi:hypothetical protein